MLTLYRLNRAPSESEGEGEDWDEWFGSLREARRRRAELIREDPHLEGHRYGEDFRIDRVVFRDLPRRALLLAVLNWNGCVEEDKEGVVPVYVPRRPVIADYSAPWYFGKDGKAEP